MFTEGNNYNKEMAMLTVRYKRKIKLYSHAKHFHGESFLLAMRLLIFIAKEAPPESPFLKYDIYQIMDVLGCSEE